jgi:hypothetical protein
VISVKNFSFLVLVTFACVLSASVGGMIIFNSRSGPVLSSVDPLELKPGTLQPGSTAQTQVLANDAAIAGFQTGSSGISSSPARGPFAETWPPISSAQEGSANSPFHNAVGAAVWSNSSLDLYDGNFNSHDDWWNASGQYENICVIGANDSGTLLNNNHFYGITSVDFYADGSDKTGPSAPVTVTSAIGLPRQITITGGTAAGSSLAALTINPTFPFSPSEMITISGATGSSSAYNGNWTVAPPSPQGTFGQAVGTLTLSTTNGNASIPAGTPAPVGATVVSTEPLYWCAHAHPKDFLDGFHEFRAVVHYLNGWTSTLETVRSVFALDTTDNEGLVTLNGGIGYGATNSKLSFLPQTTFGQSNTYDCLVPGQLYLPTQPISGGNPYWGNINKGYHWLGDNQLQLGISGNFTVTSGTTSSNGTVATFQVPHTVATNAAPYLTDGSTIATTFSIPSVTTAAANITPSGTTATLAALSTAITVNNGDQVAVSGLTNPTYTVGSISVTGGIATATLSGTGSSDVLAPPAQAALSITTISWPANSDVETVNLSTDVAIAPGTLISISGATLNTGTGNPNTVEGTVTSSTAGQFIFSNSAVGGSGKPAGTASGGSTVQMTVAGDTVNVTITGSSIPVAPTNVEIMSGGAGTFQFATTAAAGSYTGGTISLVSGGGWNQKFYTTTNASGSVTVAFPDGESYSVAPTGTASVLWQQAQPYRIVSYSFQATNDFGTGTAPASANETITVSPPSGHNITFVPGEIVYVNGLQQLPFNSPSQSSVTSHSLNGNDVGGSMGVFVTVIGAPSANTFTTFNSAISDYYGFTITSISMSGTTETVNFTIPGVSSAPVIPTGTHISVLNPQIAFNGVAVPALAIVDAAVTASSASGATGTISFTNSSGAGSAGFGTLSILDGTFAGPNPGTTSSFSGIIPIATPNPSQIVTSDLSVVPVQTNNAGVGTPDYPHIGVQISSMSLSAPGLAGVATVQYPSNIVTPAGMTITGTGHDWLISFQHSVNNAGEPCQDSNIIVSNLIDGSSNPMPYGTGSGSGPTIQQWQSLWASTNFNNNMYEPTVVVDNHQASSDSNPNQLNITGVTYNGNGTATATFTGDLAIPPGSSIIVSDTLSADPDVDGFNTLLNGPQAITGVSFSEDSNITGCSGSPTVTLTYGGSTNFFPTSSWLKVEGITNTASGPYANQWNGQFVECNTAGGSVSYVVQAPPTGTPAWTGTGAPVAVATTGVFPVPVISSTAGSPTSTVTYQLFASGATATPSAYISGGTIDIADCGQQGVVDCTTIDGALKGLHKTGQEGLGGLSAGIGFKISLTNPGSLTNVETFSTTYSVNGTWSVSGGICTIEILDPDTSFLPPGSQVDGSLNTTGSPFVFTNAFIATSESSGVTTSTFTIPCSTTATPASGGTIEWHSEFKVGMSLFYRTNGNTSPGNILNGFYPNVPYYVEASSGPASGTAGTLIPPGGSFLLSATPNGPPVSESSIPSNATTLADMQDEEDFATICLTGAPGSSPTPSSAQYYKLGNGAQANTDYFNNFGWTQIKPCPGSNSHSVVGIGSGQFGPQVAYIKISSIDMCAHTSLNNLPYCSLNDAAVYGNGSFSSGNGGNAIWFEDVNMFGYSGFLGVGGPTSGDAPGIAHYMTNQTTINYFYPDPMPDLTNAGSGATSLEFTNNTGQLSNWSLYDHIFFDGLPASGYIDLFGCANSGWTAGGFPAVVGCYNPTNAEGAGVWTGGVGSGVKADPNCATDGNGCNPANTGGTTGAAAFNCNQSGTNFGCNILPVQILQRDVQSLQGNTSTTLIPTSQTIAGGGPYLDNSTFAMALNIESTSDPVAVAWEAGAENSTNTNFAILTSGPDAGQVFAYSFPAGSTNVDICAENRQCISSCFDATLVNPSCPEGQAQFIAAGCDVQVSGVYDPTHSTSCVQFNNLNTTSTPNIINKVALVCSLFGTNSAAPSICNATTNSSDTWEEVYVNSPTGPSNTFTTIFNGGHLDIIFNKINSVSWGDEVINELEAPLAAPGCRTNANQPFPAICNGAVSIAFEELSFMGPVSVLNSAAWNSRGEPGFGGDNKYFKNNQFENEGSTPGAAFNSSEGIARLTVDTINPQPSSGKVWDNTTCWTGPAGQVNQGHVYGVGGFGHFLPQNGFSYNEMFPTTSVSVSGTTATLTFTGIPFTPLIPPGSLIHVMGLTGTLAGANTDGSSTSINSNGQFYTKTTVGSVPGTVQYTVPAGVSGSQSTGVTLDWPAGTFWNSPPFQTVYQITSISWATTGVETVNYTSTDGLPITQGSTVSVAGATTPNLDFSGLVSGSAGSFTFTNPALVGTSGSENETTATATFSQACMF